jgi:hypothetical protein
MPAHLIVEGALVAAMFGGLLAWRPTREILIHGDYPGRPDDDEPLHEWRCPNCGAVTRARMSDRERGPE